MKYPNLVEDYRMAMKIERVFRDRPLSPEAVALDAEVRSKLRAEFPPASSGSTPGRLSRALRDALMSSNRSMDEIAQDAGVSQIVVSRFLSGERDIRMVTADKLAEVLDLKLASTS